MRYKLLPRRPAKRIRYLKKPSFWSTLSESLLTCRSVTNNSGKRQAVRWRTQSGKSNFLDGSFILEPLNGQKRFVSKSIGRFSSHPVFLCRGIPSGEGKWRRRHPHEPQRHLKWPRIDSILILLFHERGIGYLHNAF